MPASIAHLYLVNQCESDRATVKQESMKNISRYIQLFFGQFLELIKLMVNQGRYFPVIKDTPPMIIILIELFAETINI